jgi:hypothetical protein
MFFTKRVHANRINSWTRSRICNERDHAFLTERDHAFGQKASLRSVYSFDRIYYLADAKSAKEQSINYKGQVNYLSLKSRYIYVILMFDNGYSYNKLTSTAIVGITLFRYCVSTAWVTSPGWISIVTVSYLVPSNNSVYLAHSTTDWGLSQVVEVKVTNDVEIYARRFTTWPSVIE